MVIWNQVLQFDYVLPHEFRTHTRISTLSIRMFGVDQLTLNCFVHAEGVFRQAAVGFN